MGLAAILASAEAQKALRKLLAAAGRRALAAKRRNGWRWEGEATRRPLALADAPAAGFSEAEKLWIVEADPANPLRLVSPEGVAFFSYWWRFPSDGGSIPRVVARKWHRDFDFSRWGHACAFAAHDAAYSSARVWIVDSGRASLAELDRRGADDLLAAGLCAEGPEQAAFAEAEAIVLGVRLGGGKAWRRWRESPPDFRPRWWQPWNQIGTN